MYSAKDPLTCGFLKVKVFKLLSGSGYALRYAGTHEVNSIYTGHRESIRSFFGSTKFEIPAEIYKTKLTPLKDVFRKISKSAPNKTLILQTFSSESWEKLDKVAKEKHTPSDCKGCLENRRFKNALSLFPITGNDHILKAKTHGLFRKPLGDITNKLSAKKQEELIKKKVVKQIEERKKTTTVAR